MDGADADERTWLTSTDVRLLLRLVAPRVGPRKLGHFFTACAESLLRDRHPSDRSTAHLPAIRAAVDDDPPPGVVRRDAWERFRDEIDAMIRLADARSIESAPCRDQLDRTVAAEFLANALPGEGARWWWEEPDQPETNDTWLDALMGALDRRRDQVVAAHLPHLRDIAGNPFRPVAFDPSWRTEAVVALARGMYEARDFAAMPVLADALEDAGCADPDVLAHCRTPDVHVRGCWVVDGVLGKN